MLWDVAAGAHHRQQQTFVITAMNNGFVCRQIEHFPLNTVTPVIDIRKLPQLRRDQSLLQGLYPNPASFTAANLYIGIIMRILKELQIKHDFMQPAYTLKCMQTLSRTVQICPLVESSMRIKIVSDFIWLSFTKKKFRIKISISLIKDCRIWI